MANLLYQLLDFLNDRFNIEEIRDICVQLGIDYEDLPAQGQGKRSFARELIRYLERRQRLEELLPILEARRPQLFAATNFPLDSVTKQDSITFFAVLGNEKVHFLGRRKKCTFQSNSVFLLGIGTFSKEAGRKGVV